MTVEEALKLTDDHLMYLCSVEIMDVLAAEVRRLRDTNKYLGNNNAALMAEVQRLREALRSQREWWRNVPSGVDIDADIDDPCPGDDMAWRAGCAIREIDEALRGGEEAHES